MQLSLAKICADKVGAFLIFTLVLLCVFIMPKNVEAEEVARIGLVTLDVPPEVSDPVFLAQIRDIQKKLPIKTRDVYKPDTISETIRFLYQYGIFAQIRAYIDKIENIVDVRFRIFPTSVISEIRFEGNQHLEDQELLRSLRLRVGDKVFKEDLAREKLRLLNTYRRHGYIKIKIEAKQKHSSVPFRDIIVFRITENEPQEITRVIFTGDLFFRSKMLENKFEVKKGNVLNVNEINDAIENLQKYYTVNGFHEAELDLLYSDSKKWQTSYLYRKGIVVIRINAGSKVFVRFIGNTKYSKNELLDIMRIEPDEILSYNYATLERFKRTLNEFYLRQGYLNSSVKVLSRQINPRKKFVTFHIHEGVRVKLKKIEFEGNDHFYAGDLADEIYAFVRDRLAYTGEDDLSPPERGTMERTVYRTEWQARAYPVWEPGQYARAEALDSDEVYIPDVFTEAEKALEYFYREQGFLSCKVSAPALSFNKTGQRLVLKYAIEEGTQTFVRSIRVKGTKVKQFEEILEIGGLEIRKPLNILFFEEASKKIEEEYARSGYSYAKVKFSYELTRNHKYADLLVQVHEGPQVKVGEILVTGAIDTKQSTILNEISFERGDVYTPEKLQDSRKWLQKLGIFQSLTIKPLNPEKEEETKSLLITVLERPPGRFEISVGLATDDGVRMGTLFLYRNLFGSALEFHFSLNANYRIPEFLDDQFGDLYEGLQFLEALEREINIGFYYPSIMGSHIGIRADLIHLREQERSYGMDKNSILIAFDTEFAKYFTIAQINEFSFLDAEYTVLKLPGEEDTDFNIPTDGITWEFSPKLQGVFDYRDNIFNPTRGVVISSILEYFETITGKRDVDLFRGLGSVVGYIPIPITQNPFVLRLGFKVGGIYRINGSETPPEKRFKLGGRTSIRGFGEEAIFPAETVEVEKGIPSYGGDAFILLKADLRIPVYKNYYAGVFTDWGNLWSDPDKMDFSLDSYKRSVGAGLHYRTPVGDISLEVGWNLKQNEALHEDSWRLHFSISLF